MEETVTIEQTAVEDAVSDVEPRVMTLGSRGCAPAKERVDPAFVFRSSWTGTAGVAGDYSD